MKKFLAALLAFVLFVTLSPSMSLAAGATYKLVIDGQQIVSDVPPVIIESRAMLPVAVISGQLGAEVKWNPKTRIADVYKDEKHLSFNIDTKRVLVNGNEQKLDYPLVVKDGRTLLPAAFLAEQFGADIKWDGKERTVSIQSVKKEPYRVMLNDRVVEVPTPEVVEGEVLLPVEAFASYFGFEAAVENRQLILTKNSQETVVSLINGKMKREDVYLVDTTRRPHQKDGVYYFPSESISLLFGAEVEIDKDNSIVKISGNENPLPEKPEPPVVETNDISNIQVSNNKVTITFEEAIKAPTYAELANPYRLVIDVPTTALGEFSPAEGEPQGLLSLRDSAFQPNSFVKEVRYSQFTENDVRVVLDLQKRSDYVASLEGNVLTLALRHVSFVVYIDAGHGDHDPGAIGVNKLVAEKTFNLNVAKKVEQLMKDVPQVKTVLTRRTDTFLTLDERVQLANNAGADAFISIHANAMSSASVGGTETFYNKSNSLSLATIAHKHMLAATGFADRKVKNASFYVIRNTWMPSILLEAGFLTNAREEKLLSTEEYQTRVAKAIVATIKEYFKL